MSTGRDPLQRFSLWRWSRRKLEAKAAAAPRNGAGDPFRNGAGPAAAGASAGGGVDLRFRLRRVSAARSRRQGQARRVEAAVSRSALQRHGRARYLYRRLHQGRPHRARRARRPAAAGLRARARGGPGIAARRGHPAASACRDRRDTARGAGGRRSGAADACAERFPGGRGSRDWRGRTGWQRRGRIRRRPGRTPPTPRDDTARQSAAPVRLQRHVAARCRGARARARACRAAAGAHAALPEGACRIRRSATRGERRRRVHAGSAPHRRRRRRGRPDAADLLRQYPRGGGLVGRGARGDAEDRGAACLGRAAGARTGAARRVSLGGPVAARRAHGGRAALGGGAQGAALRLRARHRACAGAASFPPSAAIRSTRARSSASPAGSAHSAPRGRRTTRSTSRCAPAATPASGPARSRRSTSATRSTSIAVATIASASSPAVRLPRSTSNARRSAPSAARSSTSCSIFRASQPWPCTSRRRAIGDPARILWRRQRRSSTLPARSAASRNRNSSITRPRSARIRARSSRVATCASMSAPPKRFEPMTSTSLSSRICAWVAARARRFARPAR